MKCRFHGVMLACVLARLGAAASVADGRVLLAKAAAAFERNQQQEVNWNWTAVESRTLAGKGTIQKLPDVTVESVIRNDGRRCNAVKSWGDGTAPYLVNADPDSRCQATESFRPPFAIAELLKSGYVKLVSRRGDAPVLEILPDKERQRDPDPRVRCAASIRATVKLDAATGFPREIEGAVAGSGCLYGQALPLYYGAEQGAYTQSSFQKTANFRIVYELQPDRFQAPEHSFWIRVAEHYDMPVTSAGGSMIYWGRSFRFLAGFARIVKDIHTTAQEFGTQVEIIR